MTHGLINKVDITSAEKSDAEGLKHICPHSGMEFGDKGYCGSKVAAELDKNNSHSGIIKRNHMKGKDFRHDKWLTKVGMPYEGVFSKMSKKCRYKGTAKQRFQAMMEAFVYNAKRLVKINTEPLEYAA